MADRKVIFRPWVEKYEKVRDVVRFVFDFFSGREDRGGRLCHSAHKSPSYDVRDARFFMGVGEGRNHLVAEYRGSNTADF